MKARRSLPPVSLSAFSVTSKNSYSSPCEPPPLLPLLPTPPPWLPAPALLLAAAAAAGGCSLAPPALAAVSASELPPTRSRMLLSAFSARLRVMPAEPTSCSTVL